MALTLPGPTEELKITLSPNGEITATWPQNIATAVLMLEVVKNMILNPATRMISKEAPRVS